MGFGVRRGSGNSTRRAPAKRSAPTIKRNAPKPPANKPAARAAPNNKTPPPKKPVTEGQRDLAMKYAKRPANNPQSNLQPRGAGQPEAAGGGAQPGGAMEPRGLLQRGRAGRGFRGGQGGLFQNGGLLRGRSGGRGLFGGNGLFGRRNNNNNFNNNNFNNNNFNNNNFNNNNFNNNNRTNTNTNTNRTDGGTNTNTNTNRTDGGTNTNTNTNRTDGGTNTNTNTNATRNLDHKNVDPNLLAKTTDASQINAWKQGGAGNCSSVACIKAATDAFGKEGVFDSIQKQENGDYRVKMQDGSQVSLTAQELEQAKQYSRFSELGGGKDVDFANLAYGTMAKHKQELNNYRTYDQALRSLNDGENPRDTIKWIGIPQDKVTDLNGQDKSKFDSIVAWNNRHAVFVDQKEGGGHQYDQYGSANNYGAGGGQTQYRRGRFGRQIAYRTGGNSYPNGFAFNRPPAPPPNTNGGGATPVDTKPKPLVNNGGATPVDTKPKPPVNNGGATPVDTRPKPPVNNGNAPAPVNDRGQLPPNTQLNFDHTQYQQAVEQAAKLGRPLILKVGASWCGPCRNMGANSFPDPAVQKLMKDNAVFVDVEIDRHGDNGQQSALAKQLAGQLGAQRYPTTMVASLVDRDGKLVPDVQASRTGGMDAATLERFLAAALPDALAQMEQRGFGQ